MDFTFADAIEIEMRAEKAAEFFKAVLDAEEQPLLVTDGATLCEISSADATVLSARCREHYGVDLEPFDLRLPIWELLDRLESVRRT